MYIKQCARYNSPAASMLSHAQNSIRSVQWDEKVAKEEKSPQDVELLVFTAALTGAP